MKTLSAFNQTSIDNPNVSPIKLTKIEFDGLTLFFCDRVFGDPGSQFEFDGQIYEPFILSWGNINFGSVGQLGGAGTPGETNFVVDNTIDCAGFSSFTEVFATYDPIYSKVTVYEMYEGATSASDLITKFVGTVEDIDMELEQVTVYITSYEISVSNKFSVTVADEDTYPGADPDDWGKMLPIVYGTNDRVPFISVDAGAIDVLAEDVSSAQTTITGSDLSKFPQGGGTIQIDFETMSYNYIDGNQFIGVTRGVNDDNPPVTSAIGHDTGATIAEIQSEYFFILGHPIKAFGGIYVVNRNNDENVLQSSSIYTLYTGQTGDEHPSYPGKACIVFNTLPTIAPQVNLDIDDTIDVDDAIDVDDSIGLADPTHTHSGSGSYIVWHNEYGTVFYGSAGLGPPYDDGPSGGCDGNASTFVQLNYGQAEIKTQKLYAEEAGQLPTHYRVCMLVGYCSTECNGQFAWPVYSMTGGVNTSPLAGSKVQTGYGGNTGIFKSGWKSAGFSSWSQISSYPGSLKHVAVSGTTGSFTVFDSWIEFQQGNIPNAATNVSKTGAASKAGAATKIGTVELVGNSVADTVIGGQVSADVEGWQADDSGDFGTENDLIERPDYIFKHFLSQYCGLTVADNIDSTSYDESGVLYANDNVRLGVVLLQRPDMMSFLATMGYQSKSYQFWLEGRHYLKRVPTSESTDRIIEGGRIDIDSVKVRFTPRAEVINRYVINFDKHWIGDFQSALESYRSVITVNSSPSQSIYGVLEGEPVNLDYVGNSTQALRMGNWLLDDTSYSRLVVSFSGGQYFADLEEGDIIEFRFDAGDELDKRLLGLVISESDQFRIMDMVENESGTIHITSYFVPSSTSSTGVFYPSQIDDDGYTQGANFYNTTVANIIGLYSGAPYTSTTTTTTSSTVSTTSSTTSSTSSSSTTLSTISTTSTSTTSSTASTISTSSTSSTTISTTSSTASTISTHTTFSTTSTTTTTTA